MSDELKPCPFCGGNGVSVTNNIDACWFAVCCSCDAEGPPGWVGETMESTKEQAIVNWNTRKCECKTEGDKCQTSN